MREDYKTACSSTGEDPFDEYLALPYSKCEFTLKDIDEKRLENLGKAYGIGHLSDGTFPTPAFPVRGIIHSPNLRLMVPLVFQRAQKPNSKAINVWCLVHTGSPFTCLSVKTLESFFGAGNVTAGQFYSMAIQDQNNRIECHVSKAGFEHVNILGADAMRQLRTSVTMDWNTNTVHLVKAKE